MGAVIADRQARLMARLQDSDATLEEMFQRMTGSLRDTEGDPAYEGLPAICREWDVPYGRVMTWLMADAERYAVYQRALEVQAHALVSETVGIADSDPGATDKGTTDAGAVAHAKLRIETRFRVAKHHASKVYGDNDKGGASGVTVIVNRDTGTAGGGVEIQARQSGVTQSVVIADDAVL